MVLRAVERRERPCGASGACGAIRVDEDPQSVDDGEHDERVEEREESAWSELERLHAESGPAGPLRPIGTHWDPLGHATLTVTLSESEVSWGEVSEEDISPFTR